MQNNDLAAILEAKITGNTVRIGRKLAEEIVKALRGKTDAVKHGKWEDENPIEPNPMFRAKVCSVCGRTEGSPNDFCPYCGARMDGEV